MGSDDILTRKKGYLWKKKHRKKNLKMKRTETSK